MFYFGETLTGENPINLSYEDIFRIRTSIHHDHIHQTLLHMRVYTRETKYLSFHVEHVATTSALALLEVLAKESLSSSSHNTSSIMLDLDVSSRGSHKP